MIRRGRRPRKYTIVANTIVEDIRLDWKELGLLVYLLSKPDDWQVSPAHLAKQRVAGRDAVYSMLTKLKEAGYARHVKHASGKSEWVISEDPNPGYPDQGEPNPDNPDLAEPDPANPTLVNTERQLSTEYKGALRPWDQAVARGVSRRYLGKLAKEHGTDKVDQAVVQMLEADPAEPASYIAGILTNAQPDLMVGAI